MTRSTYHHGDLRRALIDATADLIDEQGPGGFSLREVARRAEVSPAAPSHHFGDARGLLTAVAVEGFERMLEAMERIDADDPYDRLVEHARSYVDLAFRAPGHMAVMFRHDLIDTSDPTYRTIAPRTFDLVSQAVADAVGTTSDVDVEAATKTVWATCHGIAHLYSGPHSRSSRSLEANPDVDHLVRHAASIVYRGMRPAVET